jgi:hypothetical protein
MEDPDRQFESDATSYASFAFSISAIVATIFMTALQYLLYRVHFSKQKLKPPTSLELCLFTTALWTCHRVCDNILSFLIDTVICASLPGEEVPEYYFIRRSSYSLNSWAGVSPDSPSGCSWFILLFYEVLATWLISQSLILLCNTVIPVFRDIRLGNHEYIAVQLQSRTIELLSFFQELYESSSLKAGLLADRVQNDGSWEDGRTKSQVIRLERQKSDITEKGQRTLSWDLTVDKPALDEMKETLGPPGGFGELGFNVAADRVCFGAMGIGTRFELTFVLGVGGDEALKEERRRKSN